MAQQIFDDGSSLTDTVGESGDVTYSSSNATDSSSPFSLAGSASGSSSLSGVFGGIYAGASAVLNILDPSKSRLQAAKLLPGGVSSTMPRGVTNTSTTINTAAAGAFAKDWRVSLTLADPKLFDISKGSAGNIQSILADNGGVVFPYVPSVSVQVTARYQEQALTHSNYKNYFYDGSEVMPITIQGDFTVQNIAEGQYLLAAIYFFRSATKMFFGGQAHTGNPPPLLKLNGYGQHYFPNVSCVATSFTHQMSPDVDYVEIPVPGAPVGFGQSRSSAGRQTVRLPTTSQISVIVQPVYSRQNIHNNFSLDKFAKGQLLTNGFL